MSFCKLKHLAKHPEWKVELGILLVSTDEESKKEQVKGEKAHIIATSLLML